MPCRGQMRAPAHYTSLSNSQCAKILPMSQATQAITRPPTDIVRETPVSQAPNGICYAVSGEMNIPGADVERMVSAVPKSVAAALERKAYYFVPLTVNQAHPPATAS